MTRLILTLSAASALLMPLPALAKGKGAHTPKTAPAAAPSAESEDAKKNLEEWCSKPGRTFEEEAPPKNGPYAPNDPAKPALEEGNYMSEEQMASLHFDKLMCAESRKAGKTAGDSCDLSYSLIYLSVRDGNLHMKAALDKVCDKVKNATTSCASTVDSQKCAADIYKGAASGLKDALAWLKTASDKLAAREVLHQKNGKIALPNATKDPARVSAGTKSLLTANVNPANPKPSRITFTIYPKCKTDVAVSEFCEHVAASADTGYWAAKLRLEIQKKADLVASLDKAGGAADNNADNSGAADKSKSGLGLNDLVSLATLGATGAAMLCSMKPEMCGKSPQQQDPSSISSQNPANATSPTPPSTNGPESNPISNADKGGSSSSTPTFPETKLPSDSSASVHGGASGFGGDPALSHFTGGLGNSSGGGPAPASVGAVGGGGGGGGLAGGTLGGEKSPGDGSPKAAPSDNGSGSMPGGGGMPGGGSGSFSLGDKGAPPADAALKSILNGDGLPAATDPALEGLGAGGIDPNATAGADPGIDDPENLFNRAKGAHVRCLKRGCVGREIGSSI